MNLDATALVLGQLQINETNRVVLYVIGAAVLVAAILVAWRMYAKSKLAAGRRSDGGRRPR